MRSAKVWAGRVLACGHGRKPLGPECEKVLHNWRRRRGLGQHGSGHDRKARRNARACRERPGGHQQTLYQREQLHRQPATRKQQRDGSRAVPRSPGASSAILRRGGKGSFIPVKGVKIKGRKGYERSHGATLISWGVYALLGSGGPRCNAWSCRCQGAPVRTGHAHIMRIAYAWCAHGVHSVQE